MGFSMGSSISVELYQLPEGIGGIPHSLTHSLYIYIVNTCSVWDRKNMCIYIYYIRHIFIFTYV